MEKLYAVIHKYYWRDPDDNDETTYEYLFVTSDLQFAEDYTKKWSRPRKCSGQYMDEVGQLVIREIEVRSACDIDIAPAIFDPDEGLIFNVVANDEIVLCDVSYEEAYDYCVRHDGRIGDARLNIKQTKDNSRWSFYGG